MSWLEYQGGELCADGVPLSEVAAQFGTPCYLYSASRIWENIGRFRRAFSGLPFELFYAVKANSNGAILRLFSQEGLGAEVVSSGELLRAMRAGFPPQRIVFTGTGKTAEELKLALEKEIRAIVVESLEELLLISRLAQKMRRTAWVALRFHPGLDLKIHPHIATGKAGSKFGLDQHGMQEGLRILSTSDALELVGLHIHLGSQIKKITPYLMALDRLISLVEMAKCFGLMPQFIDLGGGFSILHKEDGFPLEELGKALRTRWPKGIFLILEPGRALVGDAGVLLTSVLYRKRVHGKEFVVVDAGMNDFIRPSLYGAKHRILPVQERVGPFADMDVVGPICENADFIARNYLLPPVEPGELLAVVDTGAYGFCMASQYNSRPRAAEVLSLNGKLYLIRTREAQDDLWRGEEVPPCLA